MSRSSSIGLLALSFSGVLVGQAQAEGKVKMEQLSLYSEKCLATLTAALEKVEGVSKVSCDLKNRSATAVLKDKQAARALDEALKEAGFHCSYDFDKEVLDVALTFTEIAEVVIGGPKEPKEPKAITCRNVHVCCHGCENAITSLFKDAKVTFEGQGSRKTVKIVGRNLDITKVIQSMSRAGFYTGDTSVE